MAYMIYYILHDIWIESTFVAIYVIDVRTS